MRNWIRRLIVASSAPAAILAVLCAPSMLAQVAVSGSGLKDARGLPLSAGQWCFGSQCIAVTNGAFSGTVNSGTASVIIINSINQPVLTLGAVSISSTYSWNSVVVASGQNYTGQGSPYLACAIGAAYTQLNSNYKQQAIWNCILQNNLNIWAASPIPGPYVTSINGVTGAFTFSGPGVTCTANGCVFSGTGTGVASINSTGGAFTFTGAGVSCVGTTCTFSGSSGGFPITLGSTSIGSGSTTTSVAGLTVNGVTLQSAGSSTSFLNAAGGYTSPGGSGCPLTGCTYTGQVIFAPSTTGAASYNMAPGSAPNTPGAGDHWNLAGYDCYNTGTQTICPIGANPASANTLGLPVVATGSHTETSSQMYIDASAQAGIADTITNVAVASNVLTVTLSTNHFTAGFAPSFAGLTTATFLNATSCGSPITASTSGAGGTFTCPYTHANYGSAADTGTASSGTDIGAKILQAINQAASVNVGLRTTVDAHNFYTLQTTATNWLATMPTSGECPLTIDMPGIAITQNATLSPVTCNDFVFHGLGDIGYSVIQAGSSYPTFSPITINSYACASNICTAQTNTQAAVAGQTITLFGFASLPFASSGDAYETIILPTGLTTTQIEFYNYGGNVTATDAGTAYVSNPLLTFGNPLSCATIGGYGQFGIRVENWRVQANSNLPGTLEEWNCVQEQSGDRGVVHVGNNDSTVTGATTVAFGATNISFLDNSWGGSGPNPGLEIACLGTSGCFGNPLFERNTFNDSNFSQKGTYALKLDNGLFCCNGATVNANHSEGFQAGLRIGYGAQVVGVHHDTTGITSVDTVVIDNGGYFCELGISDSSHVSYLVLNNTTGQLSIPRASFGTEGQAGISAYCNGAFALGGVVGTYNLYSSAHTMTTSELGADVTGTTTITVPTYITGGTWLGFNNTGAGTVTLNTASAGSWAASHVYPLGTVITATVTGLPCIMQVTTAGTSNGTVPPWTCTSGTTGTTYTDNTVTWTNEGEQTINGAVTQTIGPLQSFGSCKANGVTLVCAAVPTSNSDGTLTISSASGQNVASIALGHANTWTALLTDSAGINLSGTTSPLEFAGAAGSSGNCVISGGAGVTPSWGSCASGGSVSGAPQYQFYYQPNAGTQSTAIGDPNQVTNATFDFINQTAITNAVTNSPNYESCAEQQISGTPTYAQSCYGLFVSQATGTNGTSIWTFDRVTGGGSNVISFGTSGQSFTVQVNNTIEQVAQANTLSITGGQPATNASTYGSLSLTGAQITGGSSAGTAGNATLTGGSDASSSATSTAGNAVCEGGPATAGGIQGICQILNPYTVAAALANAFEVVSMTTTQDRVAVAALGSVANVGIAQTVGGTGTQIFVAVAGKTTVIFDGTPVIGDIACAPPTSTGTAGFAHDNGSTACPGQQLIGTITGHVSGSGSGATATVELHIGGSAGGSTSLAFPLTVSGTTNSGGMPYFSSTTVLTASGTLNLNTLILGGGAGGAPTNSLATDNGTTFSYSGTGGISATGGPIGASAPSGDAGLFYLVGNTVNQTCPVNDFCIFGFNSASATAYGWQPSTTAPSGTQFMMAGTPSSGASAVTYESTVTAGQGGTGVVNTATLTLGTSNQNWATLGTGLVKNTTTTGALSDGASSDVIALWTGICSSSTYLNGAGACATPGGTGTVTVVGAGSLTNTAFVTGGGTTTLQTPSATSTLSSGGNASFAGSVTAAGGLTAGNPAGGVGSQLFLTQEGTVPGSLSAAGQDNCYADSTQHGLLCNFNAGTTLPLTQGPASNTALDLAEFSGTNGGKLIDTGILTANLTQTTATPAANQICVYGSTAKTCTPTTALPAAAFPALTGDVTTSAGALGTTIAANAVTGAKMANNTVTATQLAAQYSKGSCTELWGGSGSSFALTAGDDAISNNSCYNDSAVTRTITAVKCRSDNASNTTTVNPTFGASGTGTTILSGALTCGSSLAYSSTGTVSNASWTTGTGINPVMAGTLTGTSIAMIVEYTF